MTSGIVMFCNNNKLQVNMLMCCLESLRYFEPLLPIVMFYDGLDGKTLAQARSIHSVETRLFPSRDPYSNKYLSLIHSPFDQTLYVDNDVICTRPFSQLFDEQTTLVMKKNENYDVAVLQEAVSESQKSLYEQFPWYNTGAIKYDDKLKGYLSYYLSCLDHIPKIRHFDQSIISFILFHEKLNVSSSCNGIELQLVLCDTYIKPQYPLLEKMLIDRAIAIDMNYTNHYDLFFTDEFLAFASDYFFVHYNLGNPRKPHLKEAFFTNVIGSDWLSSLIKYKNKIFQSRQ